jgi:hypothetical protein
VERETDLLVDNLVKEIADAGKDATHTTQNSEKLLDVEVGSKVEQPLVVSKVAGDSSVVSPMSDVNHQDVDSVVRVNKPIEESVPNVAEYTEPKEIGRRSRPSSCPPRAAHSVESGPWS